MSKRFQFRFTALFLSLFVAFSSCDDSIDESNRFTFTGETISSYLEKHADEYSDFITILKQAQRFKILSTYGRYTCFIPTNEAVQRFLYEQDSIYHASIANNEPINTGITSPLLQELSDSMAIIIAQSHLVEYPYFAADMYEGVLETKNFNDRFLGVSFDVKDEHYRIIINNQAAITVADIEAENGVLHRIDNVLSPSANLIGKQIGNHDYLSLFYKALQMTGMEDSLQLYKDYTYALADVLTINYAKETCNYPPTRYLKYTAFVETNETFAKYGIHTIDDLIAQAKVWYGTQEADDYTNRENALNKFISYHLLDREVAYNRLICHRLKMNNYDSEVNFLAGTDRYEYYETMLPYTLFKITKPLSDAANSSYTIMNYTRTPAKQSMMDEHINIHVLSVSDFTKSDEKYAEFSPNALNGTIHIIDKILVYNEDEMAGNVMNERMRFDIASLMPEVVTNGVKFCPWGSCGSTKQRTFIIPNGYSKNCRMYNESCHLNYLCSYTGWANYQGDEFICVGQYDFAYKLPPVPPGTYEIRLAYTATTLRGIAQFYVDDVVTGIPVDLRRYAYEPEIGWIADAATEDNGVENDKTMRNHGYMKGPNIYIYGGANLISRNYNGCIRKIVTTKYLSKGDHWIRFKNVKADDDGTCEFMHDYMEIVPMTVIRSTTGEDRK